MAIWDPPSTPFPHAGGLFVLLPSRLTPFPSYPPFLLPSTSPPAPFSSPAYPAELPAGRQDRLTSNLPPSRPLQLPSLMPIAPRPPSSASAPVPPTRNPTPVLPASFLRGASLLVTRRLPNAPLRLCADVPCQPLRPLPPPLPSSPLLLPSLRLPPSTPPSLLPSLTTA